MTDQLEINYMGVTYTFKRNHEDTVEDFYHISWLIAKQKPRTQKELEKMTQLATMWYYQKKYQCTYSPIMQTVLKELDLISFDL
jgi:hypothetical protein